MLFPLSLMYLCDPYNIYYIFWKWTQYYRSQFTDKIIRSITCYFDHNSTHIIMCDIYFFCECLFSQCRNLRHMLFALVESRNNRGRSTKRVVLIHRKYYVAYIILLFCSSTYFNRISNVKFLNELPVKATFTFHSQKVENIIRNTETL